MFQEYFPTSPNGAIYKIQLLIARFSKCILLRIYVCTQTMPLKMTRTDCQVYRLMEDEMGW